MKKLAMILILMAISTSAFAMSSKPKFDAMGCLNTAANVTCKSVTPQKPVNEWTADELKAYYKCYYPSCLTCWSKAGWNTYPGACCAPGVDCKSL